VHRPGYVPIDLRWDCAMSYELPEGMFHAWAFPDETLCGLSRPGLSPSPWSWFSPADELCPHCVSAAHAVDRRWPADRRGPRSRGGALPRGYKPPPRRTDWTGAPADLLGRPDLHLLRDQPGGGHDSEPGAAGAQAPDDVRFPASWWGTHLEVYRPHSWTGRPMERLPQVVPEAFTGDYAWLGGAGYRIDLRVAQLQRVAVELARSGLTLPADFITLAIATGIGAALDRTGYRELTGPLANPAEPGAQMIRFLHEHQWSMYWFLYLRPNGGSFIVRSEYDYERRVTGPDRQGLKSIFWCAPTAEVFAYRCWAESTLAKAIRDERRAGELTPALRAYLARALLLRPEYEVEGRRVYR
jgi:hypothetical protein